MPTRVAIKRANVLDGASREVLHAQQMKPALTHVVELRYFPGLTALHWFVWEGRRLNLDGPPSNPEGKKAKHRCFCVEYVPPGS